MVLVSATHRQPHLTCRKMSCCNRERVQVAFLVLFLLTTVVLAALLAWRELTQTNAGRNTDDDRCGDRKVINETTVSVFYPGYFQSRLEHERFKMAIETDLLPVNQTVIDSNLTYCSFNCGGKPVRKKRQATHASSTYHGCCISNVYFEFPSRWRNANGVERRLLQFANARQYFMLHNCSQASGCMGCQCYQGRLLHSGVVIKLDVQDAEELEDTEIDFFYFDGCCKCINS